MRAFAFGATAGVAGWLTYRWLTDVKPLRFTMSPHPVRTYAAALARIHALRAAESGDLNPLCHTQLFGHGRTMEQTLVCFHGYTNCPHQFQAFAPRLHALGYNVLVARLPRHGSVDPTGPDMANLTAEELVEEAGRLVDIAHGLGERVTLLGFSLGGIVAAWVAQRRIDVERAVIVAPPFGLANLPVNRHRLYANLLAHTPNRFIWWDPDLKEGRPGPPHACAGYSTRAVAALLRLGLVVQQDARRAAPLARSVVVATNPCDNVVRNEVTQAVVADWRSHGASVETYEFPAEWKLIHDLMDPEQPEQKIEFAYPPLIELITADGSRRDGMTM